jgi:hypothetical protein
MHRDPPARNALDDRRQRRRRSSGLLGPRRLGHPGSTSEGIPAEDPQVAVGTTADHEPVGQVGRMVDDRRRVRAAVVGRLRP